MNDRFLPNSILLGFIAAIVALVAIGLLGYQSLGTQVAAAEQLAHSERVRDEAGLLLTAMTDCETGQRGYLLTGDEAYLTPYQKGIAEAPAHLAALRALTEATPVQMERLIILDRYVQDKLAELARTIDLMRHGDRAAAVARVGSGQGKELMDAFRQVMSDLQKTEDDTARLRTAAWVDTTHRTFTVIAGGSCVLLVLMIAALFVTSRDFRARNIASWLKAGQSELGADLAGNPTAPELLDHALGFAARAVGAEVAVAYLAEADGKLARAAGWGAAAEAPERIARDEGLVGLAAAGRQVVEVPGLALRVASALGEKNAATVIVVPATVENQVNAVLELGLFHPLLPHQRELLDLISGQLGGAIRAARDRERVATLLEETQAQAEELQTQQEELRVTNEELEERGRALKESHARLSNQQAELEQTNSQLEAQTEALERQKASLERAQRSITAKATEVERASAYKTEFLANMSHELRTPLNSSLILARLLADNKDGNLTAEQVQFAETIHAAGSDLLNLINDILDLSKIEAGKAEVHPVRFPVARVTDSLRRMFAPLAAQKRLELAIELAPGAPAELETDFQRLLQILKNLLANAFKFTDRGTVGLRLSGAEGDRLRFAVHDTGIGIAADQHEIIFEPFRQADSGPARMHGGTGLGLSISRDLARLLGGSIELASAPGRGSTFTLELPSHFAAVSVEAAGSAIPEPIEIPSLTQPARPAPANGHGKSQPHARTLLVIEDDESFARIVADLGREQGYEPLVAGTADEGVKLARRHLPAAIVLDVGLPDHSGITVLDQLKRTSATRHIPVHVVSAHDYTQVALEMGAMGYMLKPVKREQLVEALHRVESRSARAPRRVLVVEDDPVQRDSIARLLAAENVEITQVGGAAEALARLGETTFDCMVMDLKLADGTGFDVLERISTEEAYSFPPVIIYTGRELSRDDEQRLRRYSRSIIIKDARSPERLLDEVTLFLHSVEARMTPERQRMLKQARSREAAFEGRHILVVEDDARNIFALSRILEPKGAKVEIARNGREALELLDKLPRVDLVLMDIMMPEMDGYQAMAEIRKQPKFKELPIIALTAKAMRDDQERCLAAGANDYIAKPLDVDKLLSLVRVWMPR